MAYVRGSQCINVIAFSPASLLSNKHPQTLLITQTQRDKQGNQGRRGKRSSYFNFHPRFQLAGTSKSVSQKIHPFSSIPETFSNSYSIFPICNNSNDCSMTCSEGLEKNSTIGLFNSGYDSFSLLKVRLIIVKVGISILLELKLYLFLAVNVFVIYLYLLRKS